MEHVMYFALKYLSSILHVSNILILQNFMVDKLMIEDTDSVCEISLAPVSINTTLKQHDMNKLYDKFPHRNIILCT